MLMATSPSFLPISDSPSTGDAPVPSAGHSRYFHSGDGRRIKCNLPQVIESSHRASIAYFVPSSRGILSCKFAYLCHAQVALDSHPYSILTPTALNSHSRFQLILSCKHFEDAASFCRLDRLCHTPFDRNHHFLQGTLVSDSTAIQKNDSTSRRRHCDVCTPSSYLCTGQISCQSKPHC